LQDAFAEDEAVVAGDAYVKHGSIVVEGDVVFLFGHELRVHEQADAVHEEHHFVAGCHFQIGEFGLDGSVCEREVLLHVVGVVILLVGANDVTSAVPHAAWQFVQAELL
jgi:hypothetical protein